MNRAGGPVRAQGFSARVWIPAVRRAWPLKDEWDDSVSKDERGDDSVRPDLRRRIHDLRHTNASWLIQAGVPLPVIQEHLGHESIHPTVSVYGHLDRRSMKAFAEAMDQVLAGGRL